ncbi:MAG: hypothetical protein IJU44_05555 [Kiritimatiellae bacterium]|nr:hypothetical protein [Kiritimatiellia bacterium]
MNATAENLDAVFKAFQTKFTEAQAAARQRDGERLFTYATIDAPDITMSSIRPHDHGRMDANSHGISVAI